jgi:ribosome-interacting GTPase 1
MPANLPPQYFETERKLKAAKTPQEKLPLLEELLAIVPKHKGTEKLQALIKTKIAKLKAGEQQKPQAARHGPSYIIEKSGAGQVVICGPPNAGKSLLIKSLTGASPEVGEYPYTTRAPAPYMMKFENIKIQLIDSPPVVPEMMETWVAEMIKLADGVVVVLDLAGPDQASYLESLLLKLKERKVDLVSSEAVILPEKTFFQKRTLIAANKIDVAGAADNLESLRIFFEKQFFLIPVSAARGDGLESLPKEIFRLLQIIRVFSKVPGKKPDMDEPFALKKGSTVMDMARAVHKDFAENLKYARIWSKRENAYQGQMVNRDYVLVDEDIIELHI